MEIKKINIENYKCFYGLSSFDFNEGLNILVGNNEAGKSTILEAINLALTGVVNGRYLKNELSQYLFNHIIVSEYITSLTTHKKLSPPHISIEVFFRGDDFPEFEGTLNKQKEKASGVLFTIEFDEDYKSEYEALITTGEISTIPIEYYHIKWRSFSRENVTARSIPLKSVLIDSSSNRYQNGSDIYLSRIIRNDLDDKEKAELSQAYRKMKEAFISQEPVIAINQKIKDKSKISSKSLKVSVDLSTQNSWETTLMTYLDEVPFHQIGKGEQCIIKTNLALAHQKSKEANILLIEEPENHLSHTKLNELLKTIVESNNGKQIIVSTHSSFVCNKLGLDHLILINDRKGFKLSALNKDTYLFFKKLSGYQTLRLILCRKAVLVEGDSDELIFQKAYMEKNGGKLPIEDGIDVISVAVTFKRFLDIAVQTNQFVAVITDNDGEYASTITKKYLDYQPYENIKIFADDRNTLNTMEPQFVDANKSSLSDFCKVLGISQKTYKTEEDVLKYMLGNKTACALKIFEAEQSVVYPKYILEAVEWCNE